MMQRIMSRTNNIEKYCQCARALRNTTYVKLKTATNDPSVSEKMRYSQYIRQRGVRCYKLPV
jgi:hypothetical protein